MLIGYERVSIANQSLDFQADRWKQAGCEKFFHYITSDAKVDLPGLDQVVDYDLAGDVIVVVKLDRLGRTFKHLIATIEDWNERGIVCMSFDDGMTTSTGKLMFHIIGVIVEFERDLIRECTNAGLSVARARGRKGGRPIKATPDKIP